MENILFDIGLYESHGKIIDADNIIPIERYLKHKGRDEQRKAELLRAGIKQKASGLFLIMLAIFVSKIAGGLDFATGSFVLIGIWLTLSKNRVID